MKRFFAIFLIACIPLLLLGKPAHSFTGSLFPTDGDFDEADDYTLTGEWDHSGGEFELPSGNHTAIAALSPDAGDLFVMTNGVSATDCGTGGGTTYNLCVYNGSSWVILGDGEQGAGTGSVTTIVVGGDTIDTDIVVVAFEGHAFDYTESPENTANILLDLTPASGNATLVSEGDALQVKYDTTDFGESASGLTLGASPTIATALLMGSDPADAGTLRMPSAGSIVFEDTTEAAITHVAGYGFSSNVDLEAADGNTAFIIRSDNEAADTLELQAMDVDGSYTSLVTLTSHATEPTLTLASTGNSTYVSSGGTITVESVVFTGGAISSATTLGMGGALSGATTVSLSHTAPDITLSDSDDAAGTGNLAFVSANTRDIVATLQADIAGSATTFITLDGTNEKITLGKYLDTFELGHATDTTIARASAGDITIEGQGVYRAGGTDVADGDVADDITITAGSQIESGNPAFTTIELGHASDSTIARTGAGTLTIEGNEIYRAGGTDVADGDVADDITITAGSQIQGGAPAFTTIELGHASDTTLARAAAGAATVEGDYIVLSGDTLTGEVTATFDTDGSTATTIADSIAVTSWNLTTPTVTSGAVFTGADASPNANGELVYDNVVTGIDDGAFAYYGGSDTIYYVPSYVTVPGDGEDDYVLAYDKDSDRGYWKADADTGGAPVWENVTNPTGDQTLTHSANEETTFEYTDTAYDAPMFLIRQHTGAVAAAEILLEVRAADSDVTVLEVGDGTNVWTVDTAGKLANAGTATIDIAAATDLLIASGQIDADDLAGSAAFTTTGDFIHGADPADAGDIRLSNAETIMWEASAAGTDIEGISVDASEVVQIAASGASGVTITPALTLSSTLTDGTATLNSGAWSAITTLAMTGAFSGATTVGLSHTTPGITLEDTDDAAGTGNLLFATSQATRDIVATIQVDINDAAVTFLTLDGTNEKITLGKFLDTFELGHASDTTIARVSAGVVSIEGNNIYMAGGTDVADADVADNITITAGSQIESGNPAFTTIELGHASDTTIARSGAGDLTIEGNAIYRAGGTDVADGDVADDITITAGSQIAGGSPTFTAATVDTEVYGAGWNADNTVPTKDAVYDKIQAISGDVTDVGDCTGGACLDGTSDGGTQFSLWDGSHKLTFDTTDISADATIVFGDDTNNLYINNGTAILDIAASSTVNIDKSLTIDGQATTITGATQANTITLNESITIGDGNDGTLTYTGASKVLSVEDTAVVSQDYTSDASPQFTGIELGHASDTTLARSGAGAITVEGVGVALTTSASLTTPIIANDSTLTFDESDADPNDADIALSASDGVFTIIAVNGVNNESLTFDFDAAANDVAVGTGTGVLAVDFGTINLETDALDVSDGNITNIGQIDVDLVDADGAAIAIGDNDETVAIDSSDWNIDATGAISNTAIDGDNNTITNVLNSAIKWADIDNLADEGALVVANEATDTTCFPTFVTAATGNLPLKANANLTFNSATGNLGATIVTVGTLLDVNEDVDIDFNAADEEVHIKNTAEYGADGAQVTIENTDADVTAAMYLLRLRYTDDGQANADFAVFEDNNGDDMIAFTDGGAITAAGVVTSVGFTIGSAAITETELEILDGATLSTTQANYLASATGTTGTTNTNVVFSASPTLTGTAVVAGVDGSGTISANLFTPDAADGADIGTVDLEFSDVFLADGSIIKGQNDQSNTITSSANGWDFALGVGIADDKAVTFGGNLAGHDWSIEYDQTGAQDSLQIATTAENGTADDTAMITIAVDTDNTGMDADQEVFEIGKGGGNDGDANFTELFSVDEDGDVYIAGSIVTQASTDPGVILDESTGSDTDYWFGLNADQEGDDDDYFEIGTGTTIGTNTKWQLDGSGNVIAQGNVTADSFIMEGGTYDTTIGPGTPTASVSYQWPLDDGTSGQVLATNASGVLSWTTVTATAAGSNYYVQWNNGTALDAEAAFTYNDDNNTLSVTQSASNPTVQVGDGTYSWNFTPQVGIEGVLEVDSDIYVEDDIMLDSDSAVIWLGEDADVTLTHDPDDGVFAKSIATADNNPFVLTLQTGETTIDTDTLGGVYFQAPDEAAGTDANEIAAGIEAVAEGAFSSSSNATKLSFLTGASEAAAEKMSLSSAGTLTMSGDLTVSGGDVYAGVEDTTPGDLTAYGDTTSSVTGGILDLHTAADHDTTIQYYRARAYEDDFLIGTNADADILKIAAGSGLQVTAGNVAIGTTSADDVQPTLVVQGDADSDAGGDTDEALTFTLTPNATPTSATWDITSTQSAGYTFDKEVTFLNNAAAATFGDVTAETDVVLAFDGVTAQGSITYMEDEDRFDFDNDIDVVADLTAGTITSDAALAGVAITGSGVLSTTDTTEASAIGTASMKTAGGLGVAYDVWIGDDLVLDSDATVISFGDNQDVTITHDPDDGLTFAVAGATNNEDLNIDLETTANTVTLASSTGVTTLALTGTMTTITTAAADNPYMLLDEDDDADVYIQNDDVGEEVEFSIDSTVGQNVFFTAHMDGTAYSFGDGGDDDIAITMNANTASGVVTWMEDEDYFQFADAVVMDLTLAVTGAMTGLKSVTNIDSTDGDDAYTIVAGDYGGLVTNAGDDDALVLTLPAAAAGICVTVVLAEAQDIDINPVDGVDQIMVLTNGAGDQISSDATQGSYITLCAVDATEWYSVNAAGTWSDAD